uniref:Uncharacterized protein LOC114339577 isoform X1 n=1 Tax=Diabrotica virgifera virgifera TaxID=50390 RepID=A0A6P7GA62_DIAVI
MLPLMCQTCSNDVPEDLATESEQSKEPTSPSIHSSTIIQHSSNSKQMKFSFHEADKFFLNYLKEKATKSSTETSTDSVMSFLNSLAPELTEMNMHQFKIFKRRALSLVDDILNPPSTAPESQTMSALTKLSSETSRDTIYSPQPYGSPSFVQPLQQVPTTNPLDFSGVRTQNSMQAVSTTNPLDLSGVSREISLNCTEYPSVSQNMSL